MSNKIDDNKLNEELINNSPSLQSLKKNCEEIKNVIEFFRNQFNEENDDKTKNDIKYQLINESKIKIVKNKNECENKIDIGESINTIKVDINIPKDKNENIENNDENKNKNNIENNEIQRKFNINNKLQIEHKDDIKYEYFGKVLQQKLNSEDEYYKNYYEECKYCCICNCCLCCLKNNKKEKIEDIEKYEKACDSYDKFIKNNEELSIKEGGWKTFFFLIIIIIHYISIAHINSIIYSLFRELRRSASTYFNLWEKAPETEDFNDYFENSNIKDTSQINLFYFSSFLTPFILKIFNIFVLYLICFGINIIILLIINFIDFLSPDKTKIYDNYNFKEFCYKVLAPYITLYIFTGFIASIPFYIRKKYKELSISPIYIDLTLVLAVILKICVCHWFSYTYMSLFYFYLITTSLTYLFSLIFYYCNKDIFVKEKNEIKIDYLLGKVNISSKLIDISIKTKSSFFHYLCSIFNRKLVFLLVVNLCSRSSKLKFKTEYKKYFEDDDESTVWFIIINFCLSFVISFIFIWIKCSNNICCNNIYKFSFFISFENIVIGLISTLCFFNKITGNNCIKWISYISILISGSVNFIFSDFYSHEYNNYLSISGIVSIAQCIFRGFEIFEFENIWWYFGQMVCSIIAFFACIIFCCKCCDYYKFAKCGLFNFVIGCYNCCIDFIIKCFNCHKDKCFHSSETIKNNYTSNTSIIESDNNLN